MNSRERERIFAEKWRIYLCFQLVTFNKNRSIIFNIDTELKLSWKPMPDQQKKRNNKLINLDLLRARVSQVSSMFASQKIDFQMQPQQIINSFNDCTARSNFNQN